MTLEELLANAGDDNTNVGKELLCKEVVVIPGRAAPVPILGIEVVGGQLQLITEGADLPY